MTQPSHYVYQIFLWLHQWLIWKCFILASDKISSKSSSSFCWERKLLGTRLFSYILSLTLFLPGYFRVPYVPGVFHISYFTLFYNVQMKIILLSAGLAVIADVIMCIMTEIQENIWKTSHIWEKTCSWQIFFTYSNLSF